MAFELTTSSWFQLGEQSLNRRCQIFGSYLFRGNFFGAIFVSWRSKVSCDSLICARLLLRRRRTQIDLEGNFWPVPVSQEIIEKSCVKQFLRDSTKDRWNFLSVTHRQSLVYRVLKKLFFFCSSLEGAWALGAIHQRTAYLAIKPAHHGLREGSKKWRQCSIERRALMTIVRMFMMTMKIGDFSAWTNQMKV